MSDLYDIISDMYDVLGRACQKKINEYQETKRPMDNWISEEALDLMEKRRNKAKEHTYTLDWK